MIARNRISPFFAWRSLDEEITANLYSAKQPPEVLANQFFGLAEEKGMDAKEIDQLKRLCRALHDCNLDRVYVGYERHPIRVAAAFVGDVAAPHYLHAALALCHNEKEANLPELTALARDFLPDGALPNLDILCTDRARERDPGYLATYYDAIAAAPFDLLMLKAFDKLDNFLSYAAEQVEPWHAEIVVDHLVPRLRPRHPRLSAYLERLAPYAVSQQARARHAQELSA
jgi:hypothetical protein